jgi:tryptophan synthase alpha subunit
MKNRRLVQLGADAVVIGSAVVEAALDGSARAATLIADVRKALDAG